MKPHSITTSAPSLNQILPTDSSDEADFLEHRCWDHFCLGGGAVSSVARPAAIRALCQFPKSRTAAPAAFERTRAIDWIGGLFLVWSTPARILAWVFQIDSCLLSSYRC